MVALRVRRRSGQPGQPGRAAALPERLHGGQLDVVASAQLALCPAFARLEPPGQPAWTAETVAQADLKLAEPAQARALGRVAGPLGPLGPGPLESE